MRLRPAARALLIGFATGSRSQAGLTACALSPVRRRTLHHPGPGRADRWLHTPLGVAGQVAAAVGETVGDKLPTAPPRTQPPLFVGRLALGAAAAAVLAGRWGDPVVAAAVLGAAGAAATTFGGVPARAAAAGRLGSDLPGAVAEDVLAYALAGAATRLH